MPERLRDPVHPVPVRHRRGGDRDDPRRVHRPRDRRGRDSSGRRSSPTTPAPRPALLTLAADKDGWRDLYLAALEQAGLLRPEDALPVIRDQQKVISLMATLAAGILVGPAGQEIISTGNLSDFFEHIRTWYGNNPSLLAPVEFYDHRVERLLRTATSRSRPSRRSTEYNLGLSQPTHFEAFHVYVPWIPFEDRGAGLPADFQINGAAAGRRLAVHPARPDPLPPGQRRPGPGLDDRPADRSTPAASCRCRRACRTPSTSRTPRPPRSTSPRSASSPSSTTTSTSARSAWATSRSATSTSTSRTGRALFQGDFDFTQTHGFILRVSAGVDQYKHEATWLLQAIDPLTGEVIQDPTKGLLPPNNAQGDGAGFVSYTVQPDDTVAATGNEVDASARVLFNNAPPEDTPALTQHARRGGADHDADRRRASPPARTTTSCTWNSTDDAGGSGVKHVTLYVATDGGTSRSGRSS